jgi:sugar phosphate isomerase/epimerase
MPSQISDLSRLCLHTMTTKPWNIAECIHNYAVRGIRHITIWRNALEGCNLIQVRRQLDAAEMKVASLCRGGFFAATERRKREEAITNNQEAIREAQQIGAPLLVLVCGADPGQALEASREQILEGIQRILPAAMEAGVKLAIEPLHPMYAGDRSAVNTMRQATDMALLTGSPHVGVAVDVYHVWWDPDLKQEIERCGALGRIFAFHVSDWKLPVTDLLNDRGLMGEGCIPLPEIRSWVEQAGFKGPVEVEIFSERHWASDQHLFLDQIINAYITQT